MRFRFSESGFQIEIPRTLVGGLKQAPTEEILRRIARDCAAFDVENRKLRDALERLELRLGEAAAPAWSEPPLGEELAAEPQGETAFPEEDDELASLLLDAAPRAAEQRRAPGRRARDGAIERMQSHVRKLERDAGRARASIGAALEELESLKGEIREQMRSAPQGRSWGLAAADGEYSRGEGADARPSLAPESHNGKKKSKKSKS